MGHSKSNLGLSPRAVKYLLCCICLFRELVSIIPRTLTVLQNLKCFPVFCTAFTCEYTEKIQGNRLCTQHLLKQLRIRKFLFRLNNLSLKFKLLFLLGENGN